MKGLVIKNDGVGDLVLASGLISDLSALFSDGLDLVTCEQNREVATAIPNVNKVFYVSRDELNITSESGAIHAVTNNSLDSESLKLIAEEAYDVALVLRRFIRKSTFAIMQIVDSKDKWVTWQYPTNLSEEQAAALSVGWHHVEGPRSLLPELSYYRLVLTEIFGVRDWSNPRLTTSLPAIDLTKQKKIALSIGGQSSRWNPGHWIELCRLLTYDRWEISLFGSNDQADLQIARELSTEFPQINSFVGQLGLIEALKKIASLPYYVGNDTGLSHLVGLAETKSLVIYGGGTFLRFFPWPRATNQHVVYRPLSCFDCNWRCTQRDKSLCLSLVLPSAIFTHLNDLCEGKRLPMTLPSENSTEKFPIARNLSIRPTIEFEFNDVTNALTPPDENNNTIEENINPLFDNYHRTVIIFGAGAGGLRCLDHLSSTKLTVVGFADNAKSKQGNTLAALPIFAPAQLSKKKFDYIVIASTYNLQIYSQLRSLGIKSNKILFESVNIITNRP